MFTAYLRRLLKPNNNKPGRGNSRPLLTQPNTKKMKYGIELLEELKAELQRTKEVQADRFNRIAKWETDYDDCAVSIRMSEHTEATIEMKIDILNNGGVSEFETLCDLDGNVISEKLISGKYGPCWVVSDEYVSTYGQFVGDPMKEATLTKNGLKRITVLRPAWVSFKANGGGMAGAYNGRPVIFRSETNYWTGE